MLEMAFHSGNTVKKQGRGGWLSFRKKGALIGKGWKLERVTQIRKVD